MPPTVTEVVMLLLLFAESDASVALTTTPFVLDLSCICRKNTVLPATDGLILTPKDFKLAKAVMRLLANAASLSPM